MFDSIYEIITLFVLAYPILTFYLMGSIIASGIVYSLISVGGVFSYIHKNNEKTGISYGKIYVMAIIASWVVVVVFLYGFLKGFFRSIGGNSDGS